MVDDKLWCVHCEELGLVCHEMIFAFFNIFQYFELGQFP